MIAFARRNGREAVIVAVGCHFSRFTDGGRKWPRNAGWRASLVADGFGSITDLLVPSRRFPENEIPVAELFATMPFAVLHAVCA